MPLDARLLDIAWLSKRNTLMFRGTEDYPTANFAVEALLGILAGRGEIVT